MAKYDDPRLLRAIAHPHRNRILSELYAAGPLRAADLAQRIDIPANRASLHLRQLAADLLVGRQPLGQVPQPRIGRGLHRIDLGRGRRDQQGVEAVGLAPKPLHLSKQPHLHGLMHHRLQPRRIQRGPKILLVAARRLEADTAYASLPKPRHKRRSTGRIVGEATHLHLAMHRPIQPALAHIDARTLRASLPSLHRPLLVASDLKSLQPSGSVKAPTVIQLPHSSNELRWRRSLRRLSAWRGCAKRMSRKTSSP